MKFLKSVLVLTVGLFAGLLLAASPAEAKRAKDFQRETERNFTFGSQRELAREERLEAGFTESELDEIESLSASAPKRETLVRAAELLRDRHRARARGEEVAPV